MSSFRQDLVGHARRMRSLAADWEARAEELRQDQSMDPARRASLLANALAAARECASQAEHALLRVEDLDTRLPGDP